LLKSGKQAPDKFEEADLGGLRGTGYIKIYFILAQYFDYLIK
jgi:hypothetical protein